ncbi:MAG: hypothetical protein IKV85_06865 [Ruminococcus sp.]|nr:hypothetical protein [Ruminococcus sp.]
MKIIDYNDEYIRFDNHSLITYWHEQDCYEHNYADFNQIDLIGINHNYDENLRFEHVENCGFRFGDDKLMTFIPCYSEQNGYYTNEIEIYYNDKKVLTVNCEERIMEEW